MSEIVPGAAHLRHLATLVGPGDLVLVYVDYAHEIGRVERIARAARRHPVVIDEVARADIEDADLVIVRPHLAELQAPVPFLRERLLEAGPPLFLVELARNEGRIARAHPDVVAVVRDTVRLDSDTPDPGELERPPPR